MTTDTFIVAVYFLGAITLGYFSARGVKNVKDYAIGSRKYPTIILLATIFATSIGGGWTIGVVEHTFSDGLTYLFSECLCFGGWALFLGLVIAPHMAKFKGSVSTGDVMNTLYGRNAQILTGLAAVPLSMCFLSIQIKALGHMIHYFLGMPELLGVVIGCAVVMLYSAFGGIRAVISTDTLQFGIFIIMFPIVCSVGLNAAGGFEGIRAVAPAESFQFFPPGMRLPYVIMILTCVFALSPPIIQRFLISDSPKSSKKIMKIAALVGVCFIATMGVIGFVGLKLYPDIANANHILLALVQDYAPVGIKGLMIAGLLSAIMSTADSELNVSNVALVHDVVRPLSTFFGKTLSSATEMLCLRIFAFIIGAGTIVMALKVDAIFDLVLYSYLFWSPAIMIPLALGILGITVQRWQFFISAVVSLTIVFVWQLNFKPIYEIDGTIPGCLTSAILMAFFCLMNRVRGSVPELAIEQ